MTARAPIVSSFWYFKETDTLHIEFRDVRVAESRVLDEHTAVDIGEMGKAAHSG